MRSSLLPYPFILWRPIVSYIHRFPFSVLAACARITFLSLLSHIFYTFPNVSSFQTNHAFFYAQLFYTFHIYCHFCFYVFGFYSLFLCGFQATVVLFKYPFFSYPHRSSFALPVVCLINSPCNCFCVQCVFLSLFFFFLYSFVVSLSTSSFSHVHWYFKLKWFLLLSRIDISGVSVNKTLTQMQEQKKAMSPRHSAYIPSSVKSP